MNLRIIPCQVSDEFIRGAGVIVGAAGSHHDVAIELAFSDMWAGYTKSITWIDADGLNPTLTVLTTDLLKPGTLNTYTVPIPAEPKAKPGDMTMTIKGVIVPPEGSTESSAILTVAATFRVMESKWDGDAQAGGDVNATQAEQLQQQIDTILSTISEAGESATAAEGSAQRAETAALGAKASELAAKASEDAAAGSASDASASKTAAQTARAGVETALTEAEASKNAAEASKNAAKTSETNAKQSETAAAGSAQAANTKAGEASASAAVALQKAQDAAGAASTAAGAAASTILARDAALDSADDALGSAGDAEAWAVGKRGGVNVPSTDPAYQNNAKYYKDQAGQIVGGDFVTKVELTEHANIAASPIASGHVKLSSALDSVSETEAATPKALSSLKNEWSQSLLYVASNVIPKNQKGASNGVADLDASGKVPSAQLPSYVDDVLEYDAKAAFPATGEPGKIYVDLATNLTWRWSGSAYVEISPSLALGETSAAAYRGDRGKIAYDHSQTAGNPHNLTPELLGVIPSSAKGVANGVASLDAAGKVPEGQLPSISSIVVQATAPSDQKMFWINSTDRLLYYHNGSAWVPISAVYSS